MVRNKRILVLGGSYFIGKRITEILIDEGYQVYTLNRGSRPKAHPQVQQLTCDRYDAEAMRTVLSGRAFSYVVDVSGLDLRQAQNLTAALDTTQLKGFVFISSSAVYAMENPAETPDAVPVSIPIPESADLGANGYWGDYGINKIHAEDHYKTWAPCPLAILRPPYVYGELNYARRESWVFEHLRLGRPIIVPPHNSRLQFIYTSDLARIVVQLLENKVSGTFNVGNESGISMRDWVLACAEAAGMEAKVVDCPADAPYTARQYFPFHDYDNVLAVDRIRAIYKEETPMALGLKRAYDWYVENRESIAFHTAMDDVEDAILGL